MEAHFWHNLWETNNTGWHLSDANPFLVEYFDKLELSEGSRVFVPLCGKTHDIGWLLSQGHKVVGAELNENAIKELFSSLSLEPTVKKIGNFTLYHAQNLDIFVGDIFELSKELLGDVDAIYDRGALVALPTQMRVDYTTLLKNLAPSTPQLVINYEYDQNLLEGPPFSIARSELEAHYKNTYDVTLLKSFKLDDGPFKTIGAYENVWLLK